MATFVLNALTFRHDSDAADRELQYYFNSQSFFNVELIEEHMSSQPLLAGSIFFLVVCSIALLVFSIAFLSCRWKGQCGAQKYQEYPSNSNNYALHLMLFFLSWVIVTSASSYFVLAGTGFWSEKFNAQRPKPSFNDTETVRLARSAVADLFSNPDYHGDFENLVESSTVIAEMPRSQAKQLRRVQINRPQPLRFHKPIEIPIRPLAEVSFVGSSSDKFLVRKEDEDDDGEQEETSHEEHEQESVESEKTFTMPTFVKSGEEDNYEEDEEEHVTEGSLVLSGHTMEIETLATKKKPTTVLTTIMSTTTTAAPPITRITVPSTTTVTSTTTTTTVPPTTLPPATTTLHIPFFEPEVTWQKVETTTKQISYTQLLPIEDVPKPMKFRNLHSRLLIFVCRLAFCLVALLLAFVILPSFFFVVAGTGCYIYSEHPMNRSPISNKMGQIISTYASVLLFFSPILLSFSAFLLFYTHVHELLCAAIQLQSLLLSSILLCISILPCVFAMFKLVKYYFRMSSEFYWNAADSFAGRQFSKQLDINRYNGPVIYPENECTSGYGVYGQI